jgi:hypothetical protein
MKVMSSFCIAMWCYEIVVLNLKSKQSRANFSCQNCDVNAVSLVNHGILLPYCMPTSSQYFNNSCTKVALSLARILVCPSICEMKSSTEEFIMSLQFFFFLMISKECKRGRYIYIYIYYSIRGLASEYWVKLKRLRLVIGIFYGIKYVVFIYMNTRLWRRNNISRISNQDKSIYNKLSILYYTHFVLIDQPILDLRVFLIPYNRTN